MGAARRLCAAKGLVQASPEAAFRAKLHTPLPRIRTNHIGLCAKRISGLVERAVHFSVCSCAKGSDFVVGSARIGRISVALTNINIRKTYTARERWEIRKGAEKKYCENTNRAAIGSSNNDSNINNDN